MKGKYIKIYRYKIPKTAKKALLDLQERVAEIYISEGCIDYKVLQNNNEPTTWIEISSFESQQSFQSIEQKLANHCLLDDLFNEFLEITDMKKEDIFSENWICHLDTKR